MDTILGLNPALVRVSLLAGIAVLVLVLVNLRGIGAWILPLLVGALFVGVLTGELLGLRLVVGGIAALITAFVMWVLRGATGLLIFWR